MNEYTQSLFNLHYSLIKCCIFFSHLTFYPGANGYAAYFANRGDDMEMRHLKIPFDLGRTRFVFYSPRDKESVREVIADADVVVNMVGKYYETGQPYQKDSFPYIGYKTNYSFKDVNVEWPRTLSKICLDMQVDHLIHISSASAKPDARSVWSRTKYEGEQVIKRIYPWATIVRPTQIFGRQDRLLNWFAKIGQFYRVVPLLDEGQSLTQPVWAGDVSKTLLRIIDDAAAYEGRQVDCFGPKDYTYAELAKFVDDITERRFPIVPVAYPIYKALAKVLQYQRDPSITPDLVELWAEDFLPTLKPEQYELQTDDATKILTMKDFGVEAKSIEKIMFEWLQSYRFGGHFYRVEGYH